MRVSDPLGVDDPTAHPQPLLRRPVALLDGFWDFSADVPDDPVRASFARKICVPYAPETAASGIATSDRLGRVAYRRRIAVERPSDRRVLFHLGAVDRVARCFVNGHMVGEHAGGYDPFSFDITDALDANRDAEVVVEAVDDPADLDAPRGKQEWREEPHAIWYPRTTGIWRSVWIEHVPSVRIAALDWVCDVDEMVLTLRARIEGSDAGSCTLRVQLSVDGRRVAEAATRARQPEVQVTTRIGDGGIDDRSALVWWPRRPVLLDAVIALVDDGGAVVDEVRSYTALRTVSAEDGAVRLNGRPYWLRFVLDQGYWPETGLTPPDNAAIRADIECISRLGFNGVRKHQKTEDPRWFAWADRLGMLAWVEMPSAYRPGMTSAARMLDEWRRVVETYRSHPSVIAWVPINESWGVPAAATDARQRALIDAMTAIARALDGTRPVSANDGWETSGGQIVGVHDYTQDAHALAERFATREAVDRVVRDGLPGGRKVDLARRGADGRAVVLSEFGGISLDEGGATWGYQMVKTPDELLERYAALWAACHASDGLAGACWTQLTDTYQEGNGLLRKDRSPKVAFEKIAAATRGR